MDGQPILCALGVAFHALRIPKDTNYFKSLNTITANHLSKWKGLYSHAIKSVPAIWLNRHQLKLYLQKIIF